MKPKYGKIIFVSAMQSCNTYVGQVWQMAPAAMAEEQQLLVVVMQSPSVSTYQHTVIVMQQLIRKWHID